MSQASALCVIENQIYLGLEIQGQSMPAAPNLIQTVAIFKSVNAITPTMQFTFSDESRSLVTDLNLTDGTQATLILGRYEDSAINYKFRLFGTKQRPATEGPVIVANFVTDAPEYISGAYTEGYEGTSSDVILKIADKCNLESDVTDTQDSMVWLNFGSTRGSFIEDITMHGYNGDSCCMMRGLTASQIMVYKDAMFELNNTAPGVTLALDNVQGDDITYVREAKNVSVSGVMNSWVNYGWNYTEHSLSGTPIITDKYNLKTTEPYLAINSDVQSAVNNQAKVEYGAKLDCRNTHSNYNKAYYNNLRGRALLGERMHVLVEEPTGLQLLDTVEYRAFDDDDVQGKRYGNLYCYGKGDICTPWVMVL